MRYSFGDVIVDTDRFLVECAGEHLQLQPQVFDVLVHLIEHRDRVVSKEELLDAVWGDQFVSESALTTRIKEARRAVGDDGATQAVIRTVHGRGYQFVPDVDAREPGTTDGTAGGWTAPPVEQQIRFCTTGDGVRLAYATVGEGPPLVRAAHWLTHVDDDWNSPIWRHWLTDLARGRMLVRYDERGCGLSDQDPAEITFDSFVDDLEAVVDDLGLERFPLLGISQGGPVAVEYIRRHPERVSKLVLVGAYTQGAMVRARTEEARREREVQLEMIRIGWGREDPSFRLFFTSTFIPDAPPHLWDEFARLLRRTTSAESAARIIGATDVADVTETAKHIDVPTLILHARGDMRVSFDEARKWAALIPGSRLVPLDTSNHLMRPDEPSWARLIEEIDRFLAEPEE
ncbi:MAG: alpha/beta fold hydrolase [Acidimicrobiia bacterium]|nr:alpha/beta fold hydrolase [Acidimicrobiia bacterium]